MFGLKRHDWSIATLQHSIMFFNIAYIITFTQTAVLHYHYLQLWTLRSKPKKLHLTVRISSLPKSSSPPSNPATRKHIGKNTNAAAMAVRRREKLGAKAVHQTLPGLRGSRSSIDGIALQSRIWLWSAKPRSWVGSEACSHDPCN